MNGASARRLLVSIHDVTPALEPQVRALWDLCAREGVQPALLVVPNWHGAWPIEEYPGFVGWLRERVAEGAEVFLHGERHDEVGLPRGLRDHLRAWGKTAREGEFLTLGEAAAGERIVRGVSRLTALGLPPIGFVPPAWLARADCWRAVSTAGLRYAEDDRSIYLHASHRRLPSPVVRWSGRTMLRAYGSAIVAAGRWWTQRRAPNVRIALHPGDLAHPVTARSVSGWLGRWTSDRSPTQYAALDEATKK